MAREHFSFRLAKADRSRLAEQAKYRAATESELARRYVMEGIRRDRHPRVTFVSWRPGRPVLVGRPRLEIADIIETWKLEEGDVSGAAEYLELPVGDVKAAVAYYSEFGDEIDAILEEKYRIAEHYERIDSGRRARA